MLAVRGAALATVAILVAAAIPATAGAASAQKQINKSYQAYRDADAAFRGGDWQFGEGFDKKVFLAEAGLQIVRARALALSSYVPVPD